MTPIRFKTLICIVALTIMLGAPFGASAYEEVRVYQPKVLLEEGQEPVELSPSRLHQEALKRGFTEAVTQTAVRMLKGTMSEERTEAFRTYLEPRSGDWILGYKEIASTPGENGLTMVLQVDVNRRALREVLESLGLERASSQPQYFTLLPSPTLLEADHADLQAVLALTNSQERSGFQPSLVLERMEGGTLRGQLTSGRGAWSAMDVDVATIWFALWGKYHSAGSRVASSAMVLEVSGWFTPDGAHDFDRVLDSWEDLLRTSQLLDLELLTAGVTARWEIDPVSTAGLRQRLEGYLPSRGLTFDMRAAN